VARFGAAAALAFLLVIELATAPARAALFDDEEARKWIEALRGRVDQIERSLAQRLDALETKNAGVVDLFKDVEQIKADIAKLRGQYEVLTYELEQAQKRQRDLYLDLDSRLRRLEGGPGAPAAAGTPGPADAAPGVAGGVPPAIAGTIPPRPGDLAAEQRAYDAALDQFKSGNYPAATFQAFTRTYPRSPLAPSAPYWANARNTRKGFRAPSRPAPASRGISDAVSARGSQHRERADLMTMPARSR
jgi:TolA-binding protein